MATIDRVVGRLADRSTNGPSPTGWPSSGGPSISLEQAFPKAALDSGGILALESRSSLPPPPVGVDAAVAALLSELRLIYGIGTKYTSQLHEEGYTSLLELRDHPRWGIASATLLSSWGTPFDPGSVYRSLERWLPRTDPLLLQAVGLVPSKEFLFFDLETLGLGGTPVFLAAFGGFTTDGFHVHQLLAPTPGDEAALLERIAPIVAEATALVSYNGKSFDWTVLRERFAYYGLPLPQPPIHVDLLHHARRCFADRVPDCHLTTIERRLLGIERSNDLPSAEVPIRYTTYLETGDAAHLVPIVNHSRQDLLSLVALLHRLLATPADG